MKDNVIESRDVHRPKPKPKSDPDFVQFGPVNQGLATAPPSSISAEFAAQIGDWGWPALAISRWCCTAALSAHASTGSNAGAMHSVGGTGYHLQVVTAD